MLLSLKSEHFNLTFDRTLKLASKLKIVTTSTEIWGCCFLGMFAFGEKASLRLLWRAKKRIEAARKAALSDEAIV